MPALLAVVTGALGYVLLFAAVAFPWFRVPEVRMGESAAVLIGVEAPATVAFKAASLLALAGLLLLRRNARLRARLLTLLFVTLLFFPYAVMVWSPRVAAEASALQAQHESMSWLGGDIYGEQEIKDLDFKNHVEVADSEMPVAAFPLPRGRTSATAWSRLPEMVEWLGFSNRFGQFVCRGWILALVGVACALVPLCRDAPGLRFATCETIGKTGLVTFAVGALVALIPLFATEFCVTRAGAAAQRGDPAASLHWLQRAAQVLPAIAHDSDFLAQRGLLEHRLGRITPEAALYHARQLERHGFSARARDEFDAVLALAPADSAARREAVSSLLRSSIRALNRGQTEVAIETLDCVLAHDPCNVKALYTLQLACLRASQLDRVPLLVARMDGVYRFFSTKTKAPVLASAYENGALAAYLRGQTEEALALRRVSMGHPR